MSSEPAPNIPKFELRHRLALSLDWAGITVDEMADEIGVHRNTIHNYVGGRTKPLNAILKLWAMRCGVPYEWLLSGEEPTSPKGPGEGAEKPGQRKGKRRTPTSTIWYGKSGLSPISILPNVA